MILAKHANEIIDKNIKTSETDFGKFMKDKFAGVLIDPRATSAQIGIIQQDEKMVIAMVIPPKDAIDDAKFLRKVTHEMTHIFLRLEGENSGEENAVKASIPFLEGIKAKVKENYGEDSKVYKDFVKEVEAEKLKYTEGRKIA